VKDDSFMEWETPSDSMPF